MWLSWSHHAVSDCAARTDSKRLGRALAHQLSGGPSERPSGRSARRREFAVRPRRARRSSGRSDVRRVPRSEEHTSELQSPCNLVCRLLLEKKKKKKND